MVQILVSCGAGGGNETDLGDLYHCKYIISSNMMSRVTSSDRVKNKVDLETKPDDKIFYHDDNLMIIDATAASHSNGKLITV